MVSLNPRLAVTHNGHNTWKLHISRVQINDSGSYMCQVNTDPMKSQVRFIFPKSFGDYNVLSPIWQSVVYINFIDHCITNIVNFYAFRLALFFQSGYLDVVVPPDILNHPTHNLEEGVSTEGGSIALECSAIGVPEPKVQWRREAGKEIILRADSREKQGKFLNRKGS